MKKLILILKVTLVLLLTQLAAMPAEGKTKALPRQQITSLVSEFSGVYGFETVRVGRLTMGLVKSLVRKSIRESDDPDAEVALAMLGGIKSISIVEFEDASPSAKERFTRRLDRMLDGVDLLMEAKDDCSHMRIFGLVDEEGDEVRDFIAYSPQDCVLICLYGSMSMRQLARLMK